mgnify:CR=1 FL=1
MLKIFQTLAFRSPFFLISKRSFLSAKEMIDKALIKIESQQQIEKKDLFYVVDPSHISLNVLQKDRFQQTSSGKIVLFENSKRKKILQDILSQANEAPTFVTGPTGIGKSHALSLLTLYLRNKIKNPSIELPKWLDIPNTRVLYINNPGLYYAQSFDVSIIPDLVNFIWQDLEILFPKNEFENLEFENINEVQNFIISTLEIYKKKKKIANFNHGPN